MASNSCHKLFTTGEMLREIIRQIDEPKTLARCARVNREWHGESMPLLWRGSHDQFSIWRTPEISYLAELAKSPDTFRFYVGLIKKLILLYGGPQRFHISWNPDVFFQPSLWTTFGGSMVLADLGSEFMYEKHMRVFVQPSLQAISLFGGFYSDEFLTYLQENCSLRLFLVNDKNEGISPQAMQQFIEQSPLEYLEIASGFEIAMNSPALQSAFRKPSLKHFCARINGGQSNLLDLPNMASSLRSLDITAILPMVRHIFQHLPQLESFRLASFGESWNVEKEVIQPITACPNLRELYIWTERATIIIESPSLLKFAQKCRMIDTIDIDGKSIPSDFSVSHLVAALQYWPRLVCLTFQMWATDLSSTDLASIAQSCPLLTYLSLNSGARASIFGGAIRFSRLVSLSLQKVVFDFSKDRFKANPFDVTDEAESTLVTCMPYLHSVNDTEFYLNENENEHASSLRRSICERIAERFRHEFPLPSVRQDIEVHISSA